MLDTELYPDTSISEVEKESGSLYDVTITRTGGILVYADSEENAFDKVNSMPAAEINLKGNLTGWEPSDVQLITEKEAPKVDCCLNTVDQGCIWGKMIELDNLKELVDKNNPFSTKEMAYYGNAITYDKEEYMLFHSERRNQNYFVKIKKSKKKREK